MLAVANDLETESTGQVPQLFACVGPFHFSHSWQNLSAQLQPACLINSPCSGASLYISTGRVALGAWIRWPRFVGFGLSWHGRRGTNFFAACFRHALE